MGYELWISPNTGTRRKGTTFTELKSLFIDRITTDFIYEPLYSCKLTDYALHVKETLKQKEFDIVGVINEKREIVGFAVRDELKEGTVDLFTRPIDVGKIISNATPISKLLEILLNKPFVFVINGEKVNGIVTRADINKPIVRIYIYGIISLFEMHLNFWINEFYYNESWQDLISEKRLNKAKSLYELRKGKNEDLSLLECLQFCDKKNILKKTKEFREEFDFSKNRTERLLKNIEKIRNELAHSQNSIISNLEWTEFVKTISDAEKFLNNSEKKIEEKARIPNKGYT